MSDPATTGDLEMVREEARRGGYFWLVMVVTAVVGPAMAIMFSWYNTRQSEQKFCAILAQSAISADRRLAAFAAAPPITEAGVAQRDAAAESVRQVVQLQRELNCPARR